ncbi:hypothetical protein Tco_1402818 [Tanacetum coccineum]
MAMCTKLSTQVLDLEKEKDVQAVEILKLKQRVKKLERKRKSSISHPRRRIYRQVKSSDDDLDEEDASKQGRTRMSFVQEKDVENQGVSTAGEGVSTAAPRTPPTAITVYDDEDVTMAMAQSLIKMKEEKARQKDMVGKYRLKKIPVKPQKKVKRRDQGLAQIESDVELAQILHEEELAELHRAQKETQKQKEATNAALAEELMKIKPEWVLIMELALRLTHESKKNTQLKKRATLLTEYFEKRKKQLAAERAEAIRNKPPTRAQVRNMMITFLKHMGKYTHQQLKHKTLEELQKLYQKEQKWINDFKPMDSEEDGSNTKKAGKRIKRIADIKLVQDLFIGINKIVQDSTDKIVQFKERLKAARDRQKSYANNRRKQLEFSVGDKVLLKVSPWKGVVRFGKGSKLSLRYIGPFEIVERVGPVAYRLRLPQELVGIHDTFYVSNLKKCLADVSLHVPLEEIKIDGKLRFVEEPIEIMDREVKKLKKSRISIVKVCWNSRRGIKFTWKREDEMKRKYLQLFASATA